MGRIGFCYCQYWQLNFGEIIVLHGPEYIAPLAVEYLYAFVSLLAPVPKPSQRVFGGT